MLEEDVRITDVNHELNRLDFEPTLRYIPQNCKLLDIGCGKGTYLLWLKLHRGNVESEGIDHNIEYVNYCRSKGLNVKLGDAENLDYGDKTFDVVTSFHVLEHLKDDRKALDSLMRIAKFRVVLILPATITRLEQLDSINKFHYVPYYTWLGLTRLLKGLKATIQNHYAPTGVYESWIVVLDV